MVEKVKNIIDSLSNTILWSEWDDISMYLGIARLYDQGKKLSERQQRKLDYILSLGEDIKNANIK